MIDDQSLFYDQCTEPIFYKQFENRKSSKLNDLLFNLCHQLHSWSHRSAHKNLSSSVPWSYDRQKIIALNDCFIKMSKKYEFVAIYDFDEFIFPRTFDLVKDFYDKNTFYGCSNKDKICDRTPFYFNNTNSSQNSNHLYNYFISIINKDMKSRPLSKLASIEFKRTITLSDTLIEKDTIGKLKAFVSQVNKSTEFPIYFDVINACKLKILEKDMQYVIYLIRAYERFVPCFYRDYLKDTEIIDISKARAIYLLCSKGPTVPKSV